MNLSLLIDLIGSDWMNGVFHHLPTHFKTRVMAYISQFQFDESMRVSQFV